MDVKERFLKFRKDMEALGSKASSLKVTAERLEEELPGDEEEVIKLEILEDSAAGKKKKELQLKKERIEVMKSEREDAVKRLKIMQTLSEPLKEEAFQELKRHYTPIFEKALRDCLAKLKVAAEAEQKLVEIQAAARREALVEIGYNSSPISPEWTPVLARVYPSTPAEWEAQVKRFEIE